MTSHANLINCLPICTCKPANNVFFRRDRAILCLVSWPVTVRKAGDVRTPVRVAEESNRLAERGHPLCVCTLRRGCDNTMECRTKNVITPSSEEITCIHDDSSGLKDTMLSQLFARMQNETYYRLCRLKLLCMGVLNLEPTNIVLKKEGKSAIVYARCVTVPPHRDVR